MDRTENKKIKLDTQTEKWPRKLPNKNLGGHKERQIAKCSYEKISGNKQTDWQTQTDTQTEKWSQNLPFNFQNKENKLRID
jgi:hypothetical protein